MHTSVGRTVGFGPPHGNLAAMGSSFLAASRKRLLISYIGIAAAALSVPDGDRGFACLCTVPSNRNCKCIADSCKGSETKPDSFDCRNFIPKPDAVLCVR